MSLKRALFWLQGCIILAAITSTTWLYFYPVFKGCAFPSTTEAKYDGFKDTIALHRGSLHEHAQSRAPFRLLTLADPQLEGDSSLPDPEDALSARITAYRYRLRNTNIGDLKRVLQEIVEEFLFEDIPRAFWTARKTLDLFGNDYYLAHIYRTLHWWTLPTHVTVLGDLIGSQWVSDDEFEWRGWRYWNRVLAGSEPVDRDAMTMYQREKEDQEVIQLEGDSDWSRKIINIVGNHDIGYAGDISQSRISRFERVFGEVNWDIHFSYPKHRLPANYSTDPHDIPTFHLVVLNSMILDTPVLDEEIQQRTYTYLNGLINSRTDPVEERNSTFVLLLTHVPLYKPEGICVDAPFFDFWGFEDADGAFKQGGLKEQNHLSEHASHSGVLQALFGMSGDSDAPAGRRGLILNGHDHEGCDIMHYIERLTTEKLQEAQFPESAVSGDGSGTEPLLAKLFSNMGSESNVSWSWSSARTELYKQPEKKWTSNDDGSQSLSEIVTSIREVTLRSMMGEYSGNAGLLSLWYDFNLKTWRYDIQMCSLGVQHIWWAIHVLDIITLLILLLRVGLWCSGFANHTQPIVQAKTARQVAPEERSRKALGDRRVDALAKVTGHQRSPSERRRKG